MNNDLISREALRNVILNDRKLDGANANWEVNRILVHIDNAPTVDTYTIEDIQTVREDALLLGAKLAQRPQGEWLWLGDNPNPNHKWSCNKCGRGVKEQENFCPNCGLKMRKGDAKND